MSKFKAGDKVRSLEESLDITTHDIYELIGVDGVTVSFKDNVGVIRNRGFSSVELVVVQERPFKIGDKVRCINNSGGGCNLLLGKVYKVEAGDRQLISLENSGSFWNVRRFELVEENELQIKIDKSSPIFTEGNEFDNLLNPSYYANRKIEVFDFISDTLRNNSAFTPEDGYQYASITKYTARAGRKIIGNATLQEAKLQDLKKARRHLDEWIKSLELNTKEKL